MQSCTWKLEVRSRVALSFPHHEQHVQDQLAKAAASRTQRRVSRRRITRPAKEEGVIEGETSGDYDFCDGDFTDIDD